MDGLLILLSIAAIPLMMWLMVRQRRRVRRMEQDRREAPPAETAGTQDGERRADGLVYGHRHYSADEMIAPNDSGGEVGAVRALQGRR